MKILISLLGSVFLVSCATSNTQNSVSRNDVARASSQESELVKTASAEKAVDSQRVTDGEGLTESGKAKKPRRKRVCKSDATVTSRIRRKKCRTQAEWDYIAQEQQKEVDRLRRQNPNGGRGGVGDALGG